MFQLYDSNSGKHRHRGWMFILCARHSAESLCHLIPMATLYGSHSYYPILQMRHWGSEILATSSRVMLLVSGRTEISPCLWFCSPHVWFVFLGCYNKTHWLDNLNSKHLFLTVWRLDQDAHRFCVCCDLSSGLQMAAFLLCPCMEEAEHSGPFSSLVGH